MVSAANRQPERCPGTQFLEITAKNLYEWRLRVTPRHNLPHYADKRTSVKKAMTTKGAFRNRLKAGLFALVFLNVSVAPCAMAFEAERHCPNCPPEEHHQMAGHHGSEVAASDCASLKAQCGDLDQLTVDGRVGQFDVEPATVLVDSASLFAAFSAPLRIDSPATGPPGWRPRGSPRLHQLYCVYRD